MNHSISIRSRGYLPHWECESATYFVTFRLADSLPRELIAQLHQERAALNRFCNAAVSAAVPSSAAISPAPADKYRLQKLNAILRKAEQCLDRGLGACHLRNPAIAKIVADTLLKFQAARYELFAWCVMPNHVHVLFSPLLPFTLNSILHTWKSYSAHAANRLLRRTERFWQREYFDHLVRSEFHLLKFAKYIEENPRKAGLRNWPWVSNQCNAAVSAALSSTAGVSPAPSSDRALSSPRRPAASATKNAS